MPKASKNSNGNGSGTVIITTPTNTATYTNNGVTVTPNYSNVSIAGNGAGVTYTTATTAGTWANNITLDPYYTKKPKVKISEEDIELDGLSLRETMLAIKHELQLPTRINRNEQLEREFAELKAVADQYYQLEKKFLEQKHMWATLKK